MTLPKPWLTLVLSAAPGSAWALGEQTSLLPLPQLPSCGCWAGQGGAAAGATAASTGPVPSQD